MPVRAHTLYYTDIIPAKPRTLEFVYLAEIKSKGEEEEGGGSWCTEGGLSLWPPNPTPHLHREN